MILFLQTTPMSNTHSQNLNCERPQDFANIHQVQTKFEQKKQNSNGILKKSTNNLI